MPIAAKISSYVLPLFSEHLSYSQVSNHVWNPEQIIHQMTITHLWLIQALWSMKLPARAFKRH